MSRRGFLKDLPEDYGDLGSKSAPVVLRIHYSSSLFPFLLSSLSLSIKFQISLSLSCLAEIGLLEMQWMVVIYS